MVDDAVVADVPFLLRYKKSSIKFLVVTGPVREESLPNVQTIQEAGFPQAEIEVWIGVVAPLATPASILELLNTKLRESCNASDIRNRPSNLGYRATISTVQDFHTLIYRDLDRWTRINQEMRIPTVDQQK